MYSSYFSFQLLISYTCPDYCTPEQKTLFGPIPSEHFDDDDDDDDVSLPASLPPSSSSPTRDPQSSPLSSPDRRYTAFNAITTLTSRFQTSHPAPLLRTIQRAIHTEDGPLFVETMRKVNVTLCLLKYGMPMDHGIFDALRPPPLVSAAESWTGRGIPEHVLMRIVDENYQRCVGPNVRSLKQYEAFSSTVYGELMPALSAEMVKRTRITEDTLFLDLGSGVGNVLVQASLQTGCKSFGIELMQAPARVAESMAEQIKIRCRMWGVRVGDIELEHGDMLKSKRVDELISKADVVLVDNKVFDATRE